MLCCQHIWRPCLFFNLKFWSLQQLFQNKNSLEFLSVCFWPHLINNFGCFIQGTHMDTIPIHSAEKTERLRLIYSQSRTLKDHYEWGNCEYRPCGISHFRLIYFVMPPLNKKPCLSLLCQFSFKDSMKITKQTPYWNIIKTRHNCVVYLHKLKLDIFKCSIFLRCVQLF